jgi:hypothetical protein
LSQTEAEKANEVAGIAYKGLTIKTIDAAYLDVENSPENQVFGRTKTGKKEGAYPQVCFVALVDHGTRLARDVEFGTRATNEIIIARPILNRLMEGTLCLADRQYPSFWSVKEATARGAHILWRVQKGFKFTPEAVLKDGSYLTRLSEYDENRKRVKDGQTIIVRVIEYTLEAESAADTEEKNEQSVGNDDDGEPYRLITTLLDPDFAPASELAALYPLRYYTAEGFFKEIKQVLRKKIVLVSKSPALVIQELLGLILAHFVVRMMIVKAAIQKGVPPTRLSFTNAVYVIERTLPKAENFPPGESSQKHAKRDLRQSHS